MFTWLKLAVLLMQVAAGIFKEAQRRGVKLEGYREAVSDQALETLRVVGISEKARREVATWSEDQVDDYLTRP